MHFNVTLLIAVALAPVVTIFLVTRLPDEIDRQMQ